MLYFFLNKGMKRRKDNWSARSHLDFFICTEKLSKTKIIRININNVHFCFWPSSIFSLLSCSSCLAFASFHLSWPLRGSRKRPPCSCQQRKKPSSHCFVIWLFNMAWGMIRNSWVREVKERSCCLWTTRQSRPVSQCWKPNAQSSSEPAVIGLLMASSDVFS